MITRYRAYVLCLGSLLLLTAPRPASAQRLPPPALEVSAGWASFPDESALHHLVVGGAGRIHLSPRTSAGPELTYMIGPGRDRDLLLLGNVVFDILRFQPGRPRRVSPFLMAGGGIFWHRSEFMTGPFTSREGTFAGGGGVRVSLGDRAYAASDVRVGLWDLHLRAGVTAGVRLGR